jgi:hypothetical protein
MPAYFVLLGSENIPGQLHNPNIKYPFVIRLSIAKNDPPLISTQPENLPTI